MGFGKFLSSFISPPEIAIDIGSESTLIYVQGSGIQIKEPTLVAVKERYPESLYLQFGSEAKKLIGKTPDGIKVVKPIRKGAVVDIAATEQILEYFMEQVAGDSFFKPSPKVIVAIPTSISEVERKAIEDAVYSSGAKDVQFLKHGAVAAIGAGLDISSTTPSCVLDVGGETTELAVLASSGIVYSKTFDVGSVDLIEGIENMVVEKYNIKIGVENATKLLKQLGEVRREEIDKTENMILQGKDILQNRPARVEVSQADVYLGVYPSLTKMLEAIDEMMTSLPAETCASFSEKGITLVGGGAKLKGLPELVSEYTGVKTSLAENPEECIIKGCGMLMEGEVGYLQDYD